MRHILRPGPDQHHLRQLTALKENPKRQASQEPLRPWRFSLRPLRERFCRCFSFCHPRRPGWSGSASLPGDNTSAATATKAIQYKSAPSKCNTCIHVGASNKTSPPPNTNCNTSNPASQTETRDRTRQHNHPTQTTPTKAAAGCTHRILTSRGAAAEKSSANPARKLGEGNSVSANAATDPVAPTTIVATSDNQTKPRASGTAPIRSICTA